MDFATLLYLALATYGTATTTSAPESSGPFDVIERTKARVDRWASGRKPSRWLGGWSWIGKGMNCIACHAPWCAGAMLVLHGTSVALLSPAVSAWSNGLPSAANTAVMVTALVIGWSARLVVGVGALTGGVFVLHRFGHVEIRTNMGGGQMRVSSMQQQPGGN